MWDGVGHASISLARATKRTPVGTLLDLGTGCGVQALHLATHVREVVATDVNERALWITRLNAELNGSEGIDVRDGSLFDPVAGEQYDLVVTNPPFVISPATGERLGQPYRACDVGNAEDYVERLRAFNVVDHDRIDRAERSTIYVDVRWEMKSPQGVKTDTVAQRYAYNGLADARDALATPPAE